MQKTNKLLAAALAILLAFSTFSLSLTAFAQGESLTDRIAAYTGDLSDELGAALANDYKAASDEEKDAVGVENVLKMYRLARAHVQATGGWFPIAIGNPLKLSPDFPPLRTVHAAFTAHGAPSEMNFNGFEHNLHISLQH